jgi:hypothetical protein
LLASSKAPWAVSAHIQPSSSSFTSASVRGFASFSTPSAHVGCGEREMVAWVSIACVDVQQPGESYVRLWLVRGGVG